MFMNFGMQCIKIRNVLSRLPTFSLFNLKKTFSLLIGSFAFISVVVVFALAE